MCACVASVLNIKKKKDVKKLYSVIEGPVRGLKYFID